MDESIPAWYVLYTKAMQEQAVAQQLEQKGLEVFFPCYTERRHPSPRLRPLFPGYLFVRLELERTGLAVLQWTPGLCYVVSFAGTPARMPDEAIELVRLQLERVRERGGLHTSSFEAGEHVRISSGPLAGMEAVFDGTAGSADRVRILIDFLGEVNRALVRADWLQSMRPAEMNGKKLRGTRGRGRAIQAGSSGSWPRLFSLEE